MSDVDVHLPDLNLGLEWAMLELLCTGIKTDVQWEMFGSIIRSKDLHWGEILEQALRHKMLTILAFHILSPGLENAIPIRIREYLRAILDLNRYKRSIWYAEAARIQHALSDRGIVIVGRKELAFECTIYDGNGSRRLGDLDFLVSSKDCDLVADVLARLNYRVGLYDWRSNEVIPFTRVELVKYRLSPDHLPVFSLITNDLVVRVIEVDIATSLSWSMSRHRIPTREVLEEAIYQRVSSTSNVVISCLAPIYQFMDTILHLYREACFERWVTLEQDVDLMKYSDVLHLWSTYADVITKVRFSQLMEEFNVAKPVAWVLEHLDRTFHTNIVSTLGLNDQVTEWELASTCTGEGNVPAWKGTMRERLRSKDRRSLFLAPD